MNGQCMCLKPSIAKFAYLAGPVEAENVAVITRVDKLLKRTWLINSSNATNQAPSCSTSANSQSQSEELEETPEFYQITWN